jgi:hypothetical protein
MTDTSAPFSIVPVEASSTEYPTVKPGSYTGRLVEIKSFPSKFNEGENSLVWKFLVTDRKTGEDVQVAGFTNDKFVDYGKGKESKAITWTKALLRVDKVPAGTMSETLYGREADLRVDRKKNAQGVLKNKITDVYPIEVDEDDSEEDDFDALSMD